MAAGVKALVKPELLIWARESAGFSPAHVAEKLKVTAERLQRWEDGSDRPTVRQLRELARVGLAKARSMSVVTGEQPTGNLKRPRIPDVCQALGIPCLSLLQFIRHQGWVLAP